MAMQQATAFVNHYYNVLVRLPESLYKFYQNCSIVGRPDPSGQMISVTTVGGINQLVTSPDYSALEVEIKTIDPQLSYNEGLLVLVTGSITFKNSGTRTFTQSFFLAPQKSGYFLLNDVVRYLGEPPQREEQNVSEDAAKAYAVSGPVVKPEEVGQNDVSEASTRALEEPANVADEVHKNDMQQKEVTEDSGGQKGSEIEQPPRPPQETPVEVQARQMTYASVLKQNAARPAVAVKKSSIVTGRAVPNSAQRTATTSISTAPTSSGFSIFLKNLPVNVTVSQLGEELKKFGAIKPSGITVKSRQESGYCFGFVDFEEIASVQRAIDASPILIGGRQVVIKEKRPPGEGLTKGERERGGRNNFVNKRAAGGSFPGRGDKGGSSTPSYKEVVANRVKKPMEYDKGPPQGRKRKSEQEQDGNKSRENNSTKENEEEDKE
eukprot:PITA_15648